MTNETKATLAEFVTKAAKRLEDKKVVKTRTLYIPSLDENIVVRNITKAEFLEVETYRDESFRADDYIVYIACVTPNLKELSNELRAQGGIIDPLEVVEIFDRYEVTSIVNTVMELSGFTGTGVKVVDVVKN